MCPACVLPDGCEQWVGGGDLSLSVIVAYTWWPALRTYAMIPGLVGSKSLESDNLRANTGKTIASLLDKHASVLVITP